MAKTRPPYPPEFRRQMVELVRAGRSPEELAQEFEPPPLAAGAQDVHHAVHDRPNVDLPLTATASRGRDQRLDMRPFRCALADSCPSTMEAPPRIIIGPIESK